MAGIVGGGTIPPIPTGPTPLAPRGVFTLTIESGTILGTGGTTGTTFGLFTITWDPRNIGETGAVTGRLSPTEEPRGITPDPKVGTDGGIGGNPVPLLPAVDGMMRGVLGKMLIPDPLMVGVVLR